MAQAIIPELANNAALLLVLSFLYVQGCRRWEPTSLLGQVLNGVLFGVVAIGVMICPFHLLPGVVFDTRSVVISVGGLFGGPLVAGITFVLASAYRVWQGGDGALMGVLVSLSSAALGAGYFFWKRRDPRAMRPPFLYGFGVLVHLVMLACTLALPGPLTWRVLADIAWPVILIYPAATLLLALLIADREARIAGERRLRESEERHRRMVDTANEGIWVTDAARKTTFVNRRLADLLGYRPEEMLGRPVQDFLPPGEDAVPAAAGSPHAAGQYERRLLRKDGGELWALVSEAPLAAEGAPAGILAMYSDLTRRKRAEDALRANEKRLQAILEAGADPLVVYDAAGNTTFVNPAFTRVFGWTAGEVLGRPMPFVPAGESRVDAAAIRELHASGRTLTLRTRRLTKDGEPREVVIRAAAIAGEAGEAAGMVANLTDVTHLTRLEAQLRQSHKMEAIGTLAGGIAHDFNNILGAVMGYTELAQNLAAEGAPLQAELAQIVRATEKARALVRKILTFSRKAEAELRPWNLNQSVRQSLELLTPTLPRMIAITTHLAPDLELIKADPGQIEQVLLNLAGNAADAMPAGGRFLIETRNLDLDGEACERHPGLRPGRHVLMQVSDTGLGMNRATLEHIFDPFFTTKEVGKGTGLGLSTVYGIVKSHGGEISCYSEPGRGTTFRLLFPGHQAQPAAAAAPSPPAAPAPGGSETILLVDDEEALRELGGRFLSAAGYRVLTAPSGEEALAIFRERPGEIGLVVLDLNMPGMGGHQCLEAILATAPRARVLIASGYSAQGQPRDALAAGAVGYLAKPFRRADLLATVRAALDAA